MWTLFLGHSVYTVRVLLFSPPICVFNFIVEPSKPLAFFPLFTDL